MTAGSMFSTHLAFVLDVKETLVLVFHNLVEVPDLLFLMTYSLNSGYHVPKDQRTEDTVTMNKYPI